MPTNDSEYQKEYMRQYRSRKGSSSSSKNPLPLQVKKSKVVKKLDPSTKSQILNIVIRMKKFKFPEKDIKLILELI